MIICDDAVEPARAYQSHTRELVCVFHFHHHVVFDEYHAREHECACVVPYGKEAYVKDIELCFRGGVSDVEIAVVVQSVHGFLRAIWYPHFVVRV